MSRTYDDSGFTLTELLVAMTIGMVVLFGVLGLLETTTKLSAQTVGRVEATAQVRQAMDLVTRQIRSQICLDGDPADPKPALEVATPNSMTFYASLAPEAATLVIQKRTVTYVPATGSQPGRITESVQTGAGSRPDPTFPSPATTKVIAENVVPNGSNPIFRYYKLVDAAGPTYGTPALITTTPPLPLSDRESVAQVEINFAVKGRRTSSVVALSNKVYVRTANPTKPELSPVCL